MRHWVRANLLTILMEKAYNDSRPQEGKTLQLAAECAKEKFVEVREHSSLSRLLCFVISLLSARRSRKK